MFKRESDGAVTEWHTDMTIRQQSWQQGFGCRSTPPGQYPAWRPFTPALRILGPDAAPLPECPAAYRDLYYEIPYPYRRLAEPYLNCQWLALEAMRHIEGFPAFLAQEQATIGPNFMLAVWTCTRAAQRAPGERLRLASRAMAEPRVELLAHLLGQADFDAYCLRVILALEPAQVDPDFIASLLGLLALPDMRKTFKTLPLPTHQDIAGIRRLPVWLLCYRLLALIIQEKVTPDRVTEGLTTEILDSKLEDRARIAQALEMARDWVHVIELLGRWHERLILAKPFQPPPIAGDARLQPILSLGDLVREGREMRHCVADYGNDVVNGKRYFYRWLGTERATVQLDDVLNVGWSLVEMLGAGNAPVSNATRQQIEALVLRQTGRPARPTPPPPLPPFLRSYIAGTLYHGYAKLAQPLRAGDVLQLRREPYNPYDARAVAVSGPGGIRLGYVPAAHNRTLSARMDRGEVFTAAVSWVDAERPWDIRIVIHEAAVIARQQAA